MKYNLTNINESSMPNHLAISLKGNWWKYENGIVRITVLKDLLVVSSGISTKEEDINIELPTRNPFYLQVIGKDGVETILIQGRIRLRLGSGKQLQGIVNI